MPCPVLMSERTAALLHRLGTLSRPPGRRRDRKFKPVDFGQIQAAGDMVREFAGYLEEIDLLQLPNHRIYLKLLIEGSPSKPFSAITLMPHRPYTEM